MSRGAFGFVSSRPTTAGAIACVVTWVVATPGPMPGTYTGPYPDRAVVFAELGRARPISADRFLDDDVVVLDGREIRLDPVSGAGSGSLAPLSAGATAEVRGET